MVITSNEELCKEIEAAQYEHSIGKLTYPEFWEIVEDLRRGQFKEEE